MLFRPFTSFPYAYTDTAAISRVCYVGVYSSLVPECQQSGYPSERRRGPDVHRTTFDSTAGNSLMLRSHSHRVSETAIGARLDCTYYGFDGLAAMS